MTQRTALTLIKALGVSVRYLADTREYRMVPTATASDRREALACYTDCPYDAVLTAVDIASRSRSARIAALPTIPQVSAEPKMDVYTVMVITSIGNGKTFSAGNLEFADTIAKRYPVAMIACNGVQLCVWANGVLVQGSPDARIDASSADYMRERSANLSSESDWNGCE